MQSSGCLEITTPLHAPVVMLLGNCNNMNETIVSMTVVSNSDPMEKIPEVFELRNLPIF